MMLDGFGGWMVGAVFAFWAFASLCIAGALAWGFITDREPEMPWFLRLIPFREDTYTANPDNRIDFGVFLKVFLGGFFVSAFTTFLWPLYILIGTLYSLRFAYRERVLLRKARKLLPNPKPKVKPRSKEIALNLKGLDK